MITGTIVSPSFWVLALNCLQNSMMFTPCWPRAGPTGGAGVACPAGICSLMYPVIFFAMCQFLSTDSRMSSCLGRRSRRFFAGVETRHLQKVELDGGRPAEDRHHHLQRVALEVDILDDS